jgi:hypothetical protein
MRDGYTSREQAGRCCPPLFKLSDSPTPALPACPLMPALACTCLPHPPPACPARLYRPVLQVLRLVVRLYEGVPQPDYAAICQCLMLLDDWQEVATILFRLLGWVDGWVGGCRGCWVAERRAGGLAGWLAPIAVAISFVAAGRPSLPTSPSSLLHIVLSCLPVLGLAGAARMRRCWRIRLLSTSWMLSCRLSCSR